jgi:hypothetical protein
MPEPNGYVINRMDVIQAAFTGLESNSHYKQGVIFQEQMVVGFLVDGNRRGSGSFLRGKECKENKCGRDVEPGFHGRCLSHGSRVGRFYWLMKIAPKGFCGGEGAG